MLSVLRQLTRPRALVILYFSIPIGIWFACVVVMMLVGTLTDCTAHEGATMPCIILGLEMGELLYTIGMISAWGPLFLPLVFGYTALPFGLILLISWWLNKRADRQVPKKRK